MTRRRRRTMGSRDPARWTRRPGRDSRVDRVRLTGVRRLRRRLARGAGAGSARCSRTVARARGTPGRGRRRTPRRRTTGPSARSRARGVLLVDDVGHPAERRLDVLGGDDAVVQPVGDVLGGDPAGGAVLHQRGAVDVGDLGAADAGVDPAHDVAQDALEVVLDLGAPVVLAPRRCRSATGMVSRSVRDPRR